MLVDSKFVFLCINCANKKQMGAVNHDYQILKDTDTKKEIGIRIKYHCFTCGTEEQKDLILGDPSQKTPKDKWDFLKKTRGKVVTWGKKEQSN